MLSSLPRLVHLRPRMVQKSGSTSDERPFTTGVLSPSGRTVIRRSAVPPGSVSVGAAYVPPRTHSSSPGWSRSKLCSSVRHGRVADPGLSSEPLGATCLVQDVCCSVTFAVAVGTATAIAVSPRIASIGRMKSVILASCDQYV